MTTPKRTARPSRATPAKEKWNQEVKELKHRQHLAELDKDNYVVDEDSGEDHDDEPDSKRRRGSGPAKSRLIRSTTKTRQNCTTFQQILEIENYEEYDPHIPTYLTAEAKPSMYPARHFCLSSGLPAVYTDVSTGERFAGVREYNLLKNKRR